MPSSRRSSSSGSTLVTTAESPCGGEASAPGSQHASRSPSSFCKADTVPTAPQGITCCQGTLTYSTRPTWLSAWSSKRAKAYRQCGRKGAGGEGRKGIKRKGGWEQDQKPAQRGQGLKQDGDGAAKVVTAITPGHGTHALRLGHAALLQRDLRGRGQEPRCRAVAHQADVPHVLPSFSSGGPTRSGQKRVCQDFSEPYGLSFYSRARWVD